MTANRVAYAATFESMAGCIRVCASCESSAPFKGFDEAQRAGWTWCLGVRRILWRCADCRVST